MHYISKFILLILSPYVLLSFARPRAVIHIGPHKASSTFIQKNLVKNALVFQDFNYSIIGSESPKAASTLALSLQVPEDDTWRTAAEKYFLQIENAPGNILLSSEELDVVGDTGLKILKEALRRFDVTIVYFHRERTHLLRSVWYELNRKLVNPEQFAKWVLRYMNQQKGNVADLVATHMVYRRHFDVENIVLLSFEGCMKRSSTFSVLLTDVMQLPVAKFTFETETSNSATPSLEKTQ